jgi:hypothetical protein
MLKDKQRRQITNPIKEESSQDHSQSPPRGFGTSFSEAMSRLPNEEKANERNKNPMAIIFAAGPVTEQEDKAIGIQEPQ